MLHPGEEKKKAGLCGLPWSSVAFCPEDPIISVRTVHTQPSHEPVSACWSYAGWLEPLALLPAVGCAPLCLGWWRAVGREHLRHAKGPALQTTGLHPLRARWPAHHWLSLWFRGAILLYPLSRQTENPCEICCPPPQQSSSERKWDGAFPQLLGQMVVWLVPYACPLEFRVSWRCDE